MPAPLHRRRVAAALACVVAGAAMGAARCEPRPGDRVVLVSTRPVGCATDPARLSAGVYGAEFRVEGDSTRWVEAPVEPTLSSLDPSLPIVVYIHGNLIDAPDARRRGRDVYRRLVRCAGDDRTVQFVIFSWCSGKVRGVLRDYREKAARTRPVAAQFAWTLDRLPAGSRVGVLGYSYGARVASGAAHLAAGGSMNGLRYGFLDTPPELRGVFLAGAYDACWNAAGRYHGRALDALDTLLVTKNARDPALRFYKWVPREADPPAIGDVGPRGLDASRASRVAVRDVTSSVGKSHDLYEYLGAPGLLRSAWTRLTFADRSPEPTLAEGSGEAEPLGGDPSLAVVR
ncbi:MAG: hypothetical protein AAF805_05990 [Planctomycetota bacterium]